MPFSKKIYPYIFALLASACEMQEGAQIDYNLDDYIGGSETATQSQAYGPAPAISKNQTFQDNQLVIEEATPESEDYNITKDRPYQAPDTIVEENLNDNISQNQSGVSVVTRGEEQTVALPPEKADQPVSEQKNETTSNEVAGNEVIKISSATHVVKKGDNLYSLSREYDIPIMPIIIANNLEAPYSLKTGQVIKIPEASFHVVKGQDTLYSISRKYGVDMSALTKINGLTEPFSIAKGQKLQIPFPTYHAEDASQTDVAQTAEPQVAEEQTQEQIQTSENTNIKVIEPEEDTEGLEKADAPQEGGPASLQKGHKSVFAFKDGTDVAVNNPKIATAQQAKGSIVPQKKWEKPAEQKTEVATKAEKASTMAAIAPAAIADTGKASKQGFIWPVDGKVVKAFGSQKGNEYNDGINIAASAGTQVKASSAGRVVYTGDSLKSYGNLVIVKHDNGLLSAYAHLNDIKVSKDQKIARGQVLGTVGSSGKVDSPQLYFAIRKGKEARDPNIYLP